MKILKNIQIARMYSVSDVTVKNWLSKAEKYGLDTAIVYGKVKFLDTEVNHGFFQNQALIGAKYSNNGQLISKKLEKIKKIKEQIAELEATIQSIEKSIENIQKRKTAKNPDLIFSRKEPEKNKMLAENLENLRKKYA